MHGVPTSQKVNMYCWRMHVFHTNSTILLEFVLNAWMISLLANWQATPASITMEKVVTSPNSTNSTTFTVKNFLLLVIVIKQITDFTKVPRKLNSTTLTVLLRRSNMIASHAFYFFNGMSIYLMVFLWVEFVVVLDFVMAHSACEEFFTFRALLLAASSIMLATKQVNFSFLFFFNLWLLFIFTWYIFIFIFILIFLIFQCHFLIWFLLIILHILR